MSILELDLFHQIMLQNWQLFPSHSKLYLSFFFSMLIVVFVSMSLVLVPDYWSSRTCRWYNPAQGKITHVCVCGFTFDMFIEQLNGS